MKLWEKLANLINVKTIVTFVVAAVFLILSLRGELPKEMVMTIITMVFAFYFGIQYEEKNRRKDD